jgi:hypothetical protein
VVVLDFAFCKKVKPKSHSPCSSEQHLSSFMISQAPSFSILLVAPGCAGEGSGGGDSDAVVTGNRATARRIKGLLEKEALGSVACCSRTKVVLCDVNEALARIRGGGPWDAVVGVHATKSGPALDLAQAQGIPTVSKSWLEESGNASYQSSQIRTVSFMAYIIISSF